MIKIDDFFKNFSLSEFVLEHLKDTEESFKEYITELFKHKQSTIEWFLYDYLVKEVNSSYKIENKLYDEAMIKLYDEDMLGTEITEDMLKSVNLLCRNNDELMNEADALPAKLLYAEARVRSGRQDCREPVNSLFPCRTCCRP